jgi:trimethylamine:corrinoid methyltransferase-like protein
LTDRQNWENWEQAGSKTYQQRVRERVIEILETETEPLMDEAMYKELRRICELADARHKDEELDMELFV